MEISKIILWKYGSGTCDFMVRNGELIWEDTNISKPTNSDLEKWNTEMNTAWEAAQYQRDRAAEYPPLAEQLDLLYHDMTSGKGDKTGEWYKAVNKVKTDNPKG